VICARDRAGKCDSMRRIRTSDLVLRVIWQCFEWCEQHLDTSAHVLQCHTLLGSFCPSTDTVFEAFTLTCSLLFFQKCLLHSMMVLDSFLHLDHILLASPILECPVSPVSVGVQLEYFFGGVALHVFKTSEHHAPSAHTSKYHSKAAVIYRCR
jgi:hypothetical protein